MRIVLTGGGTGGHLYPLIAVAREFREAVMGDADFVYIGTKNDVQSGVMQKEGIAAKHVASGKIRRYFSFKNAWDMFKIPFGVAQSLWLLLFYMPDAVFAKGGYASIPVVLAAWIYRIPILIHESDARPGLANRFMARFARKVAVAYPSAQEFFPENITAFTGNPIRLELSRGNVERAREIFHLTESKPVILVLGGSQGALAVNRAIGRILPKLIHHSQVIHQTGSFDFKRNNHFVAEYGIKNGRDGYVAIDFMGEDELKHALAVADLVISRAGASAIAEIAANGKPAILVPLATAANDHQRMNAYEIAHLGGAFVLEESNLGENMLYEKIEEVLFNEELKKGMGEKIRVFFHPEAARKIAQGLADMVK